MIASAEADLQRILASRAFRCDAGNQDKRDHLAHAIQHVEVDGLWLEFGVSTGGSIRCITSLTDRMVYGFDWFEGLPEDWVLGEGYYPYPRGSFRGRPLFTRPNMTLLVGLFQETLPAFLTAHAGPVAFAHVDCDLYSSTTYVLQALRDRFVAGTVIAFDDLFNYPNYAHHEMRALLELAATAGLEYTYLGHVPEKTAASIQITRVWANKR
jgi:hypothetical protein